MARLYRIGVIAQPGTRYYLSVGIGISQAIRKRRSWLVRLAGGIGGDASTLLNWPPDGVIMAVTPSSAVLDDLRTLNSPVVNFSGALPDTDIPTVRTDDRQVGRLAAEHLLELNLAHFAFWVSDTQAHSQRRRQGFFDRLREAGAADGHLHELPRVDAPDRRRRDRVIGRWLRELPKPVGLLAANDQAAYVLREICREIDLAVPGEVALLGVDDDPLLCRLSDPPLSSIRLSTQRIGAAAVAMLADMLEGRPAPPAPVLIPPLGVIARGSTDMLAVDDREVAAAVRFIRTHATRGITVTDVLDAVPLSRRTLERRFRAAFGRSPGAEIRRVQLERAKYLLAGSDASIPQVARQSGFRSPEYLTYVFRRKLGLPPTHYRKQPHSPQPWVLNDRLDAEAAPPARRPGRTGGNRPAGRA
ncbi:MAG: substrate-binding domain-containing protein [Planctomycetota bacterium]